VKVAVTSKGPDLASQVDLCFGRASCFVLVDTESGKTSVRSNLGSRRTAHAAGIQAAGALIGMGVDAVITGRIGPKAFGTFQAAQVEVYAVTSATVNEVIEKLQSARLHPLAQANAQEHWNEESKHA